MATPVFNAQKFKEQINLVRQLKGKSWEEIEKDTSLLSALAQVVEIFGPQLGLMTSGDFFEALQKPQSKVEQTLRIFSESEVLDEYINRTEIDNSQIATLLHEYQDYLAAQSEDQLTGKNRKTVEDWVKEILAKQKKTPTELAAAVATKLAKEAAAETIPSAGQEKLALDQELARREKTLVVASAQGIGPIERYAETVLERIEKEQKVNLTETEHINARAAVVLGVLVAAIPLSTQAATFALGEEEAEVIKRSLAEEATTANLKPNELERLKAKDTTAELVSAVISQTTGKPAPPVAQIRRTLDEIVNFDDLVDRAVKNELQTHEQLIRRQDYYLPPLTTVLTDDDVQVLSRSYHQISPDAPLSPYPSSDGARLSSTISSHDVKQAAMAEALKLYSRGLGQSEYQRTEAYAQKNPKSPMGILYRKKPEIFKEVGEKLKSIQRSPLGAELRRHPLTPFQARYLRFTNQLSYFAPHRFAGSVRFLTNPVGWIRQSFGRRAGSYLAGQLSRSAALASVKATALRLGMKAGLASLAAKAGLAIAGVGAGPVGWALLAVQAGMTIANKIFSPFLDFIGAKSFGEMARDTAVGAVVLLGMIPSVISAMSLAAVAPLAFFAGVGAILFWYIPTINIAPILSTMVQLESAPSGLVALGPGDILPPGEVPDSCPTGYPGNSRTVAQGPNGAYSHQQNYAISLREGGRYPSQHQAVDLGERTGTAIRATHDGQAYAFPTYTPGLAGFGNFVIVLAECQGTKFLTAYAHLLAPTIPMGGPTSVTKGQVIGRTDNTGQSSGPHLHYEIMTQGPAFDILSWLQR